MEQPYVKTGEDKQFEYYRNDSEVLSGDGTEEAYEEILNTKEEFIVKINNKQLTIKKRTLNRIMILSDSQPEEQILFSHYKTVENRNSIENLKKDLLSNDDITSQKQNNAENVRQPNPDPLISYKNIDEPLSNNNNNVAVNINTPTINTTNNNNDANDNDNIMLKKVENSNNILQVGLPPKAVKIKWFYLILVLCGSVDIIYFFYCLIAISFFLTPLLIMIFGLIIILTGLLGHNKINKKIYNDKILNILTVLCLILPIVNFILMLIDSVARAHFVFGLIINILTIIFAVLCILFTSQLKKDEELLKLNQMEKLL